jgi:hypothetical protein
MAGQADGKLVAKKGHQQLADQQALCHGKAKAHEHKAEVQGSSQCRFLPGHRQSSPTVRRAIHPAAGSQQRRQETIHPSDARGWIIASLRPGHKRDPHCPHDDTRPWATLWIARGVRWTLDEVGAASPRPAPLTLSLPVGFSPAPAIDDLPSLEQEHRHRVKGTPASSRGPAQPLGQDGAKTRKVNQAQHQVKVREMRPSGQNQQILPALIEVVRAVALLR